MEGVEDARVRDLGEGFLHAARLPLCPRGGHLGGFAGKQLKSSLEVVVERGSALEDEVRGAALAHVPRGRGVSRVAVVRGFVEGRRGRAKVASKVVAHGVPRGLPRTPAGAAVRARATRRGAAVARG